MNSIRKAQPGDLSRIAEIYVFNNRINYFPIFQDPGYSFGELQVVSLIDGYFKKPDVLDRIYVLDDGVIRGFLEADGDEVRKLYVEPCFQSGGFGRRLLEFAVEALGVNHLWALEKNTRALAFYGRCGFSPTGRKQFEEGTTEYLVELSRLS